MTQKQEPSDIVRYITVQDAVEILGVTERTIRRWIKQGKLHAIRDKSDFIRLDLADIEEWYQSKDANTPSLREQLQSFLESIEALESAREAQQCQYSNLQTEVEALQQQVAACMQLLTNMLPVNDSGQGIEQRQMLADILAQLIQRHRGAADDLLKKRGYQLGTMRLVDFAKLHQITVSELKKLHARGEIDLEVYQRKTDAIRNKQEWWINPLQHQQVADYCQRKGIPYMPCPQCAKQEGLEKQETSQSPVE